MPITYSMSGKGIINALPYFIAAWCNSSTDGSNPSGFRAGLKAAAIFINGVKRMETKIIYTLKLARFLKEKGIEHLYTVPDKHNPKYVNWVYEDTAALNAAMAEYLLNQ